MRIKKEKKEENLKSKNIIFHPGSDEGGHETGQEKSLYQ